MMVPLYHVRDTPQVPGSTFGGRSRPAARPNFVISHQHQDGRQNLKDEILDYLGDNDIGTIGDEVLIQMEQDEEIWRKLGSFV
jgi:hypothetical protein